MLFRSGPDSLDQSIQLARIHQYLSMATPLLWTRQPDTMALLTLAITTCAERNGHVEVTDRIRELLEVARALWDDLPNLTDDTARLHRVRLIFRMIHLADIESVTA